MAANTVHGVFFVVEIESFAGNQLKLAKAERLCDLVENLAIGLLQLHLDTVEVGIASALPQMRFVDAEIGGKRLRSLRSEADILTIRGHLLAVVGENGRSQGERSRLEGGVVEFHLHPDLGGTFAHLFLGDIDAAGGVVGERNATFLSHDEPYGTVDTSVDTKQNVVDGDDIGASLVISPHDDLIAPA